MFDVLVVFLILSAFIGLGMAWYAVSTWHAVEYRAVLGKVLHEKEFRADFIIVYTLFSLALFAISATAYLGAGWVLSVLQGG